MLIDTNNQRQSYLEVCGKQVKGPGTTSIEVSYRLRAYENMLSSILFSPVYPRLSQPTSIERFPLLQYTRANLITVLAKVSCWIVYIYIFFWISEKFGLILDI